MEYRHLGRSGFKVPALSFGTGTFGGQGKLFGAWGNTDVGDGWEREAYGEWYFETFSTKSYMVGVNVVTYAMLH